MHSKFSIVLWVANIRTCHPPRRLMKKTGCMMIYVSSFGNNYISFLVELCDISLSVCLSVCLSVGRSVCLSLSVSLSIHPSIRLSLSPLSLPLSLSLSLSVCPSPPPSCPSLYLDPPLLLHASLPVVPIGLSVSGFSTPTHTPHSPSPAASISQTTFAHPRQRQRGWRMSDGRV